MTLELGDPAIFVQPETDIAELLKLNLAAWEEMEPPFRLMVCVVPALTAGGWDTLFTFTVRVDELDKPLLSVAVSLKT